MPEGATLLFKQLSSCVLLTGSNSYDSAGRSWAEAQLGYALSIVEACPEFTLNPDGFGFPLEDLMKGSTNNAAGNNYVVLNRKTSVGKLAALGDIQMYWPSKMVPWK